MELGIQNPTLMDLAKRLDPDGKVAPIVEILNESTDMLVDMSWQEGNLITGHRTTVRTGLPTPTWTKLYHGVNPSKTTTAQVDESTGIMENYSEVDVKLADLYDNRSAFLLSEARGIIQGMMHDMQSSMLFSNVVADPEKFTGFAPRYNDLSADNKENIIDAGGTGSDLTSIWFVVWSDQTCFGIIPKGSTAGLQMEDQGRVTSESAGGIGRLLEVYRSHFRWDAGLCLRDWRYVVRIANIDESALTPDGSSGPKLPDLLFEAQELVPMLTAGRTAFYMNRRVRTKLRQQLSYRVAGSTLVYADVGGRRAIDFQGTPIRRVDALNTSEAQVT